MSSRLIDDFGQLTGEELFNLLITLDRHVTRTVEAMTKELCAGRDADGLAVMMLDLVDVRIDALSQLARIVVPMTMAQAIIWRQAIARRRFIPQTPDAQSQPQARPA